MNDRDTPGDDEAFDALALHDHVPISWQPDPLGDPLELERHHQATARALQALSLFEEPPREISADPAAANPELSRLEAKVDVLLSLASRLLGEPNTLPASAPVVLRPGSLEWCPPARERAAAGETGIITLYPNPVWPLPFRLPAQITSQVERGDSLWQTLRFIGLLPSVEVGLEKLIFRRHRRQVALARGTGIFAQPVFPAPPKN
ncbi:MAG: PilZ domain-containing protein [Chromatiales bacterium]|nr:PilZ domain-containing protein [Chromatiales bacterium]